MKLSKQFTFAALAVLITGFQNCAPHSASEGPIFSVGLPPTEEEVREELLTSLRPDSQKYSEFLVTEFVGGYPVPLPMPEPVADSIPTQTSEPMSIGIDSSRLSEVIKVRLLPGNQIEIQGVCAYAHANYEITGFDGLDIKIRLKPLPGVIPMCLIASRESNEALERFLASDRFRIDIRTPARGHILLGSLKRGFLRLAPVPVDRAPEVRRLVLEHTGAFRPIQDKYNGVRTEVDLIDGEYLVVRYFKLTRLLVDRSEICSAKIQDLRRYKEILGGVAQLRVEKGVQAIDGGDSTLAIEYSSGKAEKRLFQYSDSAYGQEVWADDGNLRGKLSDLVRVACPSPEPVPMPPVLAELADANTLSVH